MVTREAETTTCSISVLSCAWAPETDIAANKAAVEQVQQYFKDNEKADAFVALLDVDGNAKILQSVISQAKQLGKSVYVFSVDGETQKIAHANYVAPALKAQGVDARTWAGKVTDIVGGKAGGKEDSAQGVGLNEDKADEALAAAQLYLLATVKVS